MTNISEYPMPGDAIMLDVGCECTGVKPGTVAVLEGRIGQCRDEYMACFSASAFNDGQCVNCSGGPVPYVSPEQLVATGEMITVQFWRWKDGMAGAHRGEYYQKEVPLWKWQPGGYRDQADKALATYRFWSDSLYVREAQRASAILGYPVVERPRPINIRGFLPNRAPESLGEFVVWLCETANIGGSSDPAYLCNVIAAEAGFGDGCGSFFGAVRIRDDDHRIAVVEKIAGRIKGSYGSCLAGKVSDASLRSGLFILLT